MARGIIDIGNHFWFADPSVKPSHRYLSGLPFFLVTTTPRYPYRKVNPGFYDTVRRVERVGPLIFPSLLAVHFDQSNLCDPISILVIPCLSILSIPHLRRAGWPSSIGPETASVLQRAPP